MSESLTKKQIIRDRHLIERLIKQAPGIKREYIGVRILPNSKPFYRVLVLAHRKARGVLRNKLRRIGKEMFRRNKGEFPAPCNDIVLWLNSAVIDASQTERQERFISMVRELIDRKDRKGRNG